MFWFRKEVAGRMGPKKLFKGGKGGKFMCVNEMEGTRVGGDRRILSDCMFQSTKKKFK